MDNNMDNNKDEFRPKTSLSRRHFLKHAAGFAVGAVALPQIVPANALGRGGRTAPSNRIVLGHIGVGGQGMQHVVGGIWTQSGGMTGREDVQVVAVCDVNANRRENAKNQVNQRYGNTDCAAYRDFREVLTRKDVDAVLVATGERWHPLITIAAAKAGKDIYCEKPLSVTIEEALAAREAVNRYGVVFQMGTQQRTSQAFAFACELVRNGHIGDLKEVVVAVGGPVTYKDCHLPAQPVPDWLDYDLWLGPAPWRPYNDAYVGGWMAYRDFSGGEMTNWGAHHFDIAQWGIGMDNSGPVEIIPPDGKDVPVITYRYPNGVILTRDPDRMARESGEGNGVMFFGTKGKVAVWRYDLKTWPENLKRVKIGPNETRLYRGDNHHTDFVNAVKTRGKTNAPVEVGARSITVCHLGNVAYELGRPVKWDPAKERFVNDSEADRLFSRPMRAPWHL
jgi:predicted dehydrogenase